MDHQLSIVLYSQENKHLFYEINAEWISDMFFLEDIDKEVLQNPDQYIIGTGGHIFFAAHPEHGVVGTCALMNKGDGAFELTKMGVFKKARGLKVGEYLLKYTIAQAKELKIDKLFLLTNSACEAAIHLYEKNGFVHSKDIKEAYGCTYERCDVAMLYTR